jgi:protein-S-isoprenylcysteine O-methyltransferase Ste14
MTTRALIVLAALFALDSAGIAWLVRPETRHALEQVEPALAFFAACFFLLGTIGLLVGSIYRYAPPPLDEALIVLLIVAIVVALIVPAMQHSRSKSPPTPRPARPPRALSVPSSGESSRHVIPPDRDGRRGHPSGPIVGPGL